MNELILKKTARRARVFKGHPWVFSGEVEECFDAMSGDWAILKDARGRILGSGIYNPKSKIIWRRYSSKIEAFDAVFLDKAIRASINRRSEGSCRRLVWSEADHLPGLIVDQYEGIIVVQVVTAAMDHYVSQIAEILEMVLSPDEILFRNDAPSRKYEGLKLKVFTQSGDPLPAQWIEVEGMAYYMDLEKGHKTGFYLDQREEHCYVANLAKGRRVLDGCCNQGAFALHCKHQGASEVIGIDDSQVCIDLARKNAEKNGLDIDFQQANLFDYFTKNKEARFDLIILDPPSFAKSKKHLKGALRGYKELNLRAFKALNPGGILATYSCSQHVDRALFAEVIAEAAVDAHVQPRLLRRSGQPLDHPTILTIPESNYLKGFVFEI